jgi:oligopeptide transport system ATP-binding protein
VTEPLLDVRDLHVTFRTEAGRVGAVDGVSFSVSPGEVLGIVGESGSGKSVTMMSVMRLINDPNAIFEGQVMYKGADLMEASESRMQDIRGAEMAMIFQDPMTSLNPVYKIGDQVSEPLRVHRGMSKKAAWAEGVQLLSRVGIANPKARADEYPYQFSGGMRQRAMIAMAIANTPRILIADEPTTALDVTIQAQILELMQAMQRDFGSAIILITHDLGVIAGMADRVLVMYGGRVVEAGTVDEVFYNPQHPYTWGLLGSVPRLDLSSDAKLATIPGQPPNLLNMDDQRCPFAHRCRWVNDACLEGFPAYSEVSPSHKAACVLEPNVRRALAESELTPVRASGSPV